MTRDANNPVTWNPDPAVMSRTHMQRFMQFAADNGGQKFSSYEQLYRWSIDSPMDFWGAFAAYSGLEFSTPPVTMLSNSESMCDARWFAGATLNFTEQLLRGPDDQVVLVGVGELRDRIELTRGELRQQVAAVARNLQAMGVCEGDRVAALLPNCPEAVVVFLAAASIGAVFSSCSPDFGLAGVIDRFGQIEPTVLFVCDGYSYAGKAVDCRQKALELITALPSVKHSVEVAYARGGLETGWSSGCIPFESLLVDKSAPDSVGGFPYAQLPFAHPLVILFSSGTTGKPKCIVHGAGGTLLQHMKELLLHTDISHHDCLFYFTTCGWMMWNWLISGLACGARIVLYDGSPLYPDAGKLWRLAERESITVFGTSPRYLIECEKAQLSLRDFQLQDLRTILSTGSPLPPQSFDYVADQFVGRVQLSSISGGTDIISCFALGNPLLPVQRGELQCPGLGMAVEVYDAGGNAVHALTGELVCTQPFPSMPIGFWNDPDGQKYQQAYFAKYANVWAHGDLAELTASGGLVIHGRSDAVLNPGGVRIGTAEIYGPVLAMAEVRDCVAVGQVWAHDVRIVLFIVLAAQVQFVDSLERKIRATVKLNASPRHVPEKILVVDEIPRTRSGKIVELAVRAAIHNEAIENLSAIANPESLEAFRGRAELAN
jgi:acetoacetyl-CoA synthetase